MIDKKKKKLKGIFILIFCGIVIFFMVIGLPILTAGCNSEACFREKHPHIGETTAEFTKIQKFSTWMGLYQYIVDGKTYITEGDDYPSLIRGDEFKIIYDKDNPDDCYILYYEPVIPEEVVTVSGKISELTVRKSYVEIWFNYTVQGTDIRRLQCFPLDIKEKLDSLYKNKIPVPIEAYIKNAYRGYINLEKI